MRRSLALVIAAGLALTGCALRPRVGQFIGSETVAPVRLQLVERKSQLPVPGASIEVGEGRGRLNLKTDAHGIFILPVDQKLPADALIVIGVPAGIGRVEVVPAPGTVAPPLAPPADAPTPSSAI